MLLRILYLYTDEDLTLPRQPISTLSMCAKVALSKLARDSGVTVILTGEGADETFAGCVYE